MTVDLASERRRAVAIVTIGQTAARLSIAFDTAAAISAGTAPEEAALVLLSDASVAAMADGEVADAFDVHFAHMADRDGRSRS